MKKTKEQEALLSVYIKELQFANLLTKHLLSVLDELEVVADDKLVLKIIKNAKERHYLDKLINVKLIFNPTKGK